MSGFTDRADAALADPILKIAVERTAGTAEAKRAVAIDASPISKRPAPAPLLSRIM